MLIKHVYDMLWDCTLTCYGLESSLLLRHSMTEDESLKRCLGFKIYESGRQEIQACCGF